MDNIFFLIHLAASLMILLVMLGVVIVISQNSNKHKSETLSFILLNFILISLYLISANYAKNPIQISVLLSDTLFILFCYILNQSIRKTVNPTQKELSSFLVYFPLFFILVFGVLFSKEYLNYRLLIVLSLTLIMFIGQLLSLLEKSISSIDRKILVFFICIEITIRISLLLLFIFGLNINSFFFLSNEYNFNWIFLNTVFLPLYNCLFINYITKEFYTDIISRHQFDYLTGCLNKEYGNKVLNREINLLERNKSDLVVMMIDIDDFKKINDTKGHILADQVLISFVLNVSKYLRTTDYFIRFGGDEFLIILPNTNTHSAYNVAKRIVEGLKSDLEESLTVSIGMTSWISNSDNQNSLVMRADTALYEAKRKGKSQLVIV